MNTTLYERYPALTVCREAIERTVDALERTYRDGGKILICGNGGSCADSDHIVGELLKGFLKKRPISDSQREMLARCFPNEAEFFAKNLQQGIPALSLHSQTAALTAFANDVEPSMIYAQHVFALGKPGDTVIGITTSGNSANVINALKVAKSMGLTTVCLTGEKPCLADGVCDIVIKAPDCETYKVQEYHLPIYHEICACLEARIFES